MSTSPSPTLKSLEFCAYIDQLGEIPIELFQNKVGVYAVFDHAKVLQYVGFSRNVYTSLREHLVRCPQQCYWVKLHTIDRPSRTILQETRDAWIAENGTVPSGNGIEEELWTQAIDAKLQMTPEEKEAIEAADDAGQIKLLKNLARRVEAGIIEVLEARGVKMALRFDPKLKEKGLLTLK